MLKLIIVSSAFAFCDYSATLTYMGGSRMVERVGCSHIPFSGVVCIQWKGDLGSYLDLTQSFMKVKHRPHSWRGVAAPPLLTPTPGCQWAFWAYWHVSTAPAGSSMYAVRSVNILVGRYRLWPKSPLCHGSGVQRVDITAVHSSPPFFPLPPCWIQWLGKRGNGMSSRGTQHTALVPRCWTLLLLLLIPFSLAAEFSPGLLRKGMGGGEWGMLLTPWTPKFGSKV